MLILQKPEGYCFEKNIPDIVLQKQNDETIVNVTLKLGETVILEENYKFDADGIITIRRIDEIVSAYLVAQKSVVGGNVITTGLNKSFTVEFQSVSTIALEILGIDNIDQLIIEQQGLPGLLSQSLSIGDKLFKIGNTSPNLLITAIDDQTNTLTFNGNVNTYATAGDFGYFEIYKSNTSTFSVIRCEADMPDGLNAGTFAAQNFLTRLAREKRTATNRNEYLTYIHFGSYANVVVKYKVYYISEGIYSNKTGDFLTIASGSGDRHITFNASLSALRIAAALPIEEILQYDLWFTESVQNVESNAYTFLIDSNYYRNKTHFVFENTFGMLETFSATGITENKISNEYNLANIQSRYRKTSQDFVSQKTCNSGFLQVHEMEWINDILLSYNIGLYVPGESGMSEEITITDHEKTDTDANKLQAFQFSYRRSKNNHLQFAAAALGIFDNTYDQTYN